MEKQKKLSGIIPPVITPLKSQLQLDLHGVERLTEHIINGGVSGLFVLGTTGEGPSLPVSLKKEFVELICRQVNGRIPVLAGVADTSFSNTIEIARYAADCGAYASVLMTPFFFKVTQKDLIKYIRNLIAQIPTPVLLYNIPAYTKMAFEYESLKQLTDEEKIIGIKDSSGDMDYFSEILKLKKDRPDWSIMCGPDKVVLEAMKAGADGGVNAGANIIPEVYVTMYNESANGNFENAEKLNNQVMRLYEAAHLAKPYIVCFKHMLKCMGICDSFISEPFHEIEPQAAVKVKQYLKKAQLI